MFDNIYISDVAGGIFKLLYVVVVLGTIIIVLLDNRNPLKSIAWILVLTFLPFIGLVIYFFFGQDQRRERMISKKSYSHLLEKPKAKYKDQDVSIPADYKTLIAFFKNTDQSFPYDGNQVEVYSCGYSKLNSLIKELYKAKEHIHIDYYIFEDDAVGRLVRDVLIDRARAGVRVRIIYDDVGCWGVSKSFFESMRYEGIEVKPYLKVLFPLFTSKVNYRNHRKIVVIDGITGFVGGMNLATRYVKGVEWGVWRDSHIMLKGRAVHGLQTAFLLDWYFVDHTLLSSDKYFPQIQTQGNVLCQIVTSEPIGLCRTIMQGLLMTISSSKHYLYIQTPYFLPTEPIQVALKTAALAGVDVRIMLPAQGDSKLTFLASCSYIEDMLYAGVKVYFYQKGFMHAKTVVSDDALCSVGTTNIDFRSFEHNFEVNAFLYSKETSIELKNAFLVDLKDSEEIQYKRWKSRPLFRKMIESILRLLSPLL